VEKNNILYTPQTGNILPGITRATILEICAQLGIHTIEQNITLADVHGADSAFFCGTAAEVIGIASLDKIQFRKEWKDSLGSIIQKEYKNLVKENKKQGKLETA
jgi:branched-chain amino acid aminotransferase